MIKQIFDMYDKIPEGVDTDSLEPEMNIDPEDIKKSVLASINNQKNSSKKKAFNKKLTLTLIAAVVGISILGTVSAAAFGGFKKIFGERFAGNEVSNIIYPGENADLNTNKNIKAELIGIIGDNNEVMAAVSLTKSDGSAFVDYKDTENTILTPSLTMRCVNDKGEVIQPLPYNFYHGYDMEQKYNGSDEDYIKASISDQTKAQFNTTNHAYIGTGNDGTEVCHDDPDYDMRLTDQKTANLIYDIKREYFSLKGETMSVKQDFLYILHKDETLLECTWNLYDVHNDNLEKVTDEVIEVINQRKDALKENQTIIMLTDRVRNDNINSWNSFNVKCTLYMVTTEKIDIDFKGSWKLDYEPKTIEMKTADNLNFDGINFKVSNLTAGSLGTEMTISTNEDITSFGEENHTNLWIKKLLTGDVEITLKNGKKLKGLFYTNQAIPEDYFAGRKNGTSFKIHLSYYKYNKYNNMNIWTSLDPDEIESITIGSQQVTSPDLSTH